MQRLLALHSLWLGLAVLLLAGGGYVNDNAVAQLPVALLLFFASTPFLLAVLLGQVAALFALAYGLGDLSSGVLVAYVLMAAGLMVRDGLLIAEARIPAVVLGVWRYGTRDLRVLFWLAAVGFAVAVLFRPVPVVPALSMAALYALFAWAMRRRHPALQGPSTTLASVVLLVVSCLGCAAFLEVAARMLVPVESGSGEYLMPDPEYLYRLTPGFEGSVAFWPDTPDVADTMDVRISDLGLRDRDYPPKAEDEFRVLLLGDSYTFGWALEIDDALSRVMERDLAVRFPDRRITVVNGGTGGYGPWQTMGLFLRVGESIAPDVVIMQTNTANDISDSLRKENKFLKSFVASMEKTMQRYRHQFLWQVQVDQWLRRHCRLYYIASRTADDASLFVNAYNAFRAVEPIALTRVPQPDPRPWNYEPDLTEWYPELEHGWELMQQDLLEMKAHSEALGADFAVYNMPNPFDIATGNEVTEAYPGRYTLDKNTRIVETFCRAHGTDCIPVLPLFREHSDPAGLYFHNDGHLNPEGTRLLGARLAAFVADRYLSEYE